jgi:hypothetical protein
LKGEVKDSRLGVVFIVQPYGTLAVFDSTKAAQTFIDEYPDEKDRPFMAIEVATLHTIE